MEMGNIDGVFEPLSGQLTQTISKPNGCGIRFGAVALVPAPQHRAQPWRKEMLKHFMDSWRVRPFQHLKPIMCGDQRTDLTQFAGTIGRFGEATVITLLQL